jgi:8-oxo-dGTP diphosphatase
MAIIHVVAAVIVAADKKILLAKRPAHVHQGGLWEFPGGKVEEGENAEQALARELEEELAICVTGAAPLLKVRHDYPEKTVLLDVWKVSSFSGCAKGNEGQPIVWVAIDQLGKYPFPEANQPIVEALQSSL